MTAKIPSNVVYFQVGPIESEGEIFLAIAALGWKLIEIEAPII